MGKKELALSREEIIFLFCALNCYAIERSSLIGAFKPYSDSDESNQEFINSLEKDLDMISELKGKLVRATVDE